METKFLSIQSFTEFCSKFIKIKKPVPFVTKDGTEFMSIPCLAADGSVTFLGFSAKLGELTPQQIKEMKNDLSVVQLESGNYKLCKKPTNLWEDMDL